MPNKITALLKDQILQAGAEAHPEGMVGYLRDQANENPTAFMTLLGKVLPTQVAHSGAIGTFTQDQRDAIVAAARAADA